MTQDKAGNKYQDNSYETLLSVYPDQEFIEIKSTVKTIYGVSDVLNAFAYCHNVKSVTFPADSQLNKIGDWAFFNCGQMTNLDLSVCTHLTYIGNFAFRSCTLLSTVSFPSTLETIGQGTFSYTGLTSVTLTKGITKIGSEAFSCSQKIENIHFDPEIGITVFGSKIFRETSITSIEIPKLVTKIDSSAFWGTKKLATITTNGNTAFIVSGKILYNSNQSTLVYCPAALTTGAINIPDTVIEIQGYAFHSCKASEVFLGSKVTTIGKYCFSESLFTKATLKDTVQTVMESAFAECSLLSSVTISTAMKKLPPYMFYNSGLTSISLPDNIVEIGASCFEKCTKLTNAVIPANLTVFGGGAFSGCPSIKLSFAEGSQFSVDSQFIISSNQGKYLNQYIGSVDYAEICIAAEVERIIKGAFKSNRYIKKVTFAPDSKLTTIEENAFQLCRNLTTVIFPESLKTVGKYAFQESSIQSVSFGAKLETLGAGAFHTCLRITEANFTAPETKLDISSFVFINCVSLHTLVLPEGITILNYQFAYNTPKLTTIVIPSTVMSIEQQAFSHSGLQTVTFSSDNCSLETIGENAFANTKSLTSFQFPEGLTTIGLLAFSDSSINQIELPTTIQTLSERCFMGCSNLTTFAVKENSKLSTIQSSVFEGCECLKNIALDNENFKTTNDALYSRNMDNMIVFAPASTAHFICLPSEVKEISPASFFGCTSIYSIQIPDDSSLSKIGTKCFSGCTNLRSINLPEKVTQVGIDAFSGCDLLTCGIVVSNEDPAFRSSLVKDAKMPARCLEACKDCHTLIFGNRRYNNFSLLFLVSSSIFIYSS